MSRSEFTPGGERGSEGSSRPSRERPLTPAKDLDLGVSSGPGRGLPARAPQPKAVPSSDKEVKAPEPGALPKVGRAIGREGDLSERAGAVAAKEGTGIIEGTFKAFAEWVVQTFADGNQSRPLLICDVSVLASAL